MDDYGSKLKYTQNENVFEVEEIFTNILLRLPVKSLLICKSVCKYWWSLICSRSFMNLHLIQSQENPTYVFHRYTLRGGNIHLLTKADGETTESFLPGCPGFYSKEPRTHISTTLSSEKALDVVPWTYWSATLPPNKSCYSHQPPNQNIQVRLVFLLALRSMNIRYFSFSTEKCIFMNVGYILPSLDHGNPLVLLHTVPLVLATMYVLME
eukprot:XP_019072528.1 PREDICTED: uncharacterized protein LOC109121752 isoform X2 [Vitis vinifera]